MWQIELLQKYSKLQKYCNWLSDIFSFAVYIINNIYSKNRNIYQQNFSNCTWFFSNINFWVNANMQNSAYKKLLNLKLSRNSCCLLIFLLNLEKGFAIVKNVKKLKFEGNWDEIWAKHSPLWTTNNKIHGQN